LKSEVAGTSGEPAALDAGGEPMSEPAAPKGGRAGRDLRAAIIVGVSLAGLIFATLFTVRVLWVGVICLAVGMGAYELVTALKVADLHIPRIPVAIAGAAVPAAAYAQGTDGLVIGLFIAVIVSVGWRAYDPRQFDPRADLGRDLAATLFCLGYTGFLAGFAGLLSRPSNGPRLVIIFIATAALNDVGGYAAGVLSGGRHKLAPRISPGKSWEGLGGSIAASCLCAGIMFPFLIHRSALLGIVFGLAAVAASTLGDLSESMLKRDIGIKDMGHLLPGHGGVMDRLDSLLATAPVAYLLLTAWAH
jgi:phosphatidate cytidylyltransferase